MVRDARPQPRHRRIHPRCARSRAGALDRRPRPVARARAVVEVPVRRLAVRSDRAVQPRRRRRDRRGGVGGDGRRPERREGLVGATARAGVARRDEPVVVEPAAGEVRECRRDGDRAAARAGVLHGRLRAVARARPVLEVPRRRAAVRIDRPVQRRRRRRHARCGAGDHRRRGQGREDPVRAAAGAGTVRRNDAIVVGRSGGEPGERPGDGDVRRAGADARARRLRAVARARPVLDVPGRRLAAGLTVPLTVADVGPTAPTGPVIAVGAAATAAAPATTQASAEAVRRLAIPSCLRIRPPFAVCLRKQIGSASRGCKESGRFLYG